jgi:uncharacterized membrane protein YfcA
MTDALLLALAGVAGGLTGSMAGLASLVSYPALLAFGLPPVAANTTNTTAMVATGFGAATSSTRELRGLARRVVIVCCYTSVGALAGAAILLMTPPSAFANVVPWLIGLGSCLLLGRDAIRRSLARFGEDHHFHTWAWPLGTLLVGAYAGYFGAGAGIMLLAILNAQRHEPLAVSNAVKNIGTAAANLVAAVIFLLRGEVDVSAALILGVGLLVGAWIGPHLFRRVPERPLRYAIAAGGMGLALWLAS